MKTTRRTFKDCELLVQELNFVYRPNRHFWLEKGDSGHRHTLCRGNKSQVSRIEILKTPSTTTLYHALIGFQKGYELGMITNG